MAAPPIPPGVPPQPPKSADPKDLGFHPQERVRWFAPGVLFRTAIQVVVAGKFSELLDRRDLQSGLDGGPVEVAEDGATEFWVDYVADTGDGFDATLTIASVLARETLELGGELTHGGSLLVLGGDAVYPAASEQAYEDRLVGPFRMALPWTATPRHVVALPGNHDWYDALTSFLRLFCRRPDGRWIGGWKTAQSRSYWAVRLPQGWWLWGVDIQLGSYIDPPQLAYFQEMRGLMAADDRIILCWAKPTWTDEVHDDDPPVTKDLNYFVDTVVGDRSRVRLCLAGDKHHYARYVPPEGSGLSEKLTVGGGGAYLSATHQLKDPLDLPSGRDSTATDRHRLVTRYPDEATSRKLTWNVLGAIYGNGWRLWLVLGLLYAMLAAPAGWFARETAGDRGVGDAIGPAIALAATTVLLGFGLRALASFSSRPATWRALLAALFHLTLVAAVLALVVWQTREFDRFPLGDDVAGAVLACGVAGLVVGPFVTGVYLLVAQLFRVNVNELFSAMAVEDYKCFLRIHITAEGDLRLFPVKVQRIPTWHFAGGGGERWYRPSAEPKAELIETAPIEIRKRPK